MHLLVLASIHVPAAISTARYYDHESPIILSCPLYWELLTESGQVCGYLKKKKKKLSHEM